MNINEALISSAITSGIYGFYKLIQHYRLKSECNKDNEIVIGIVRGHPATPDIERGHPEHPDNHAVDNHAVGV
jgi:hypothetical protein